MHPKFEGAVQYSHAAAGPIYFLVAKGVTSIDGLHATLHEVAIDLSMFTGTTHFPTLTYWEGYVRKIYVPKGRKQELASMTNWAEYAHLIEEVEVW